MCQTLGRAVQSQDHAVPARVAASDTRGPSWQITYREAHVGS